jgi:hypothetical protein
MLSDNSLGLENYTSEERKHNITIFEIDKKVI